MLFDNNRRKDSPNTILTTCLNRRAVGVPEGHERRLHQLREEDIFTDQHKLGVMVAAALAVTGWLCMLHHAEHRDHQTWNNNRVQVIEEERPDPSGLVDVQVFMRLRQKTNQIFLDQL